MEELLEKIDNLKKALDETECIKKIEKLNEKMKNEKELITLIEQYKSSKEEKLKYKIYKNDLYKEYKETETDINLLIFEINSKLKTITSEESCI